jgi:hypothetical protein
MSKIRVVVTKHAIRRIAERAGDPQIILSYLRGSKELMLIKNNQGYELIIPLKGRLVGDFDDEVTFVAKSFLFPFRNRTDYYANARKSKSGYIVRISSVLSGTANPAFVN